MKKTAEETLKSIRKQSKETEKVTKYAQEKIIAEGFDANDPLFWQYAGHAPIADEKGKPLTIDKQIEWAVSQTKQYHDKIRTKLKSEDEARGCEEVKMKKTAEETLKSIQKQLKEMDDRNMRIVNAEKLYAEVSRCIQKIKDKQKNILKLNTARGRGAYCPEGFPLQYEEIESFGLFIANGLNELESIFFNLQYFSPPPKDWKWKNDEIKLLKIQSTSDMTAEKENELGALVMALRFILIERNILPLEEQCKVDGLKRRIRNLQRIIVEGKRHEELRISNLKYQGEDLERGAKLALSFNREMVKMEETEDQEGTV